MIKPFCGSTLFDIACSKLELLPFDKKLKWVSVYEEELINIACKYNISIHYRSKESANAEGPPSKIWEICGSLGKDNYVMFNPCLPFLSTNTILEFIDTFLNSKYPSLFGVSPFKNYLWGPNKDLIFPEGVTMLNTKLCPQGYLANHSLYAGSCEDMMKDVQLGDFSRGNPLLYVIDNKIESLDIDDEEDWIIAESVYLRGIRWNWKNNYKTQ